MIPTFQLTYATHGFLASHWFTDLASAAAMADALAATPDVERVQILSVDMATDSPMIVERVRR